MELLEVKANNFGSFKYLPMPLDRGVCLISGFNRDDKTSNGSGKTTLLEAIPFALFGELSKNIKIDEIINNKTKEKCSVELTALDGENKYKIIRTRKPNDLKFFINEEEILCKDSKELQEKIEKTLGINFKTFLNSIYFSQASKIRFVESNDTEKQEILTELLDMSVYDQAREYTVEQIKDKQKQLESIQNKKHILQSKIDSNKIDIKSFYEKIDSLKKTRLKNIEDIKNNIFKKQLEKDSLLEENQKLNVQLDSNEYKESDSYKLFLKQYNDKNKDLDFLKVELNELKKLLPEKKHQSEEALIKIEQMSESLLEVDDIKEVLSQVQSKISEINHNIKTYNKEIAQLTQKNITSCPTCGQSVDNSHLASKIKECKNFIEGESKELPNLQDAENQLKENLNAFEGLQQEIFILKDQSKDYERHEEKIKNIDKRVKELSDTVLSIKNNLYNFHSTYKNEIQSKIKTNQSLIDMIEDFINIETGKLNNIQEIDDSQFEDLIKKKESENLSNTVSLSEFEDKVKEIEEELTYLEFLKTSYKNVKYYIFENVINELNSKVNEYISTLFDTPINVKFDTETKNTKGEIKQKFTVSIVKEDQERSLDSFSGGEKRRVELATSFALSDIVSNRSHKSFNFLMLDECFEGLDEEGRSRIVNLLEVLKDKRENIFIIDHFESLKGLIDNEIHVIKENGISYLDGSL